MATGGYALKRYDRYARLAQDAGGHSGASPIRGWRNNTPQCRRHRRRPDDRYPPAIAGPPVPARAGACSASWRNISSSSCRRATRSSSRAKCWPSKASAKTPPLSPRTKDSEAQVPSYKGGKFPLSTFLAQRVREMVSKPETWNLSARSGARMAAHPGMALGHAAARPIAGRDLSARPAPLSRLLSLRRALGASDAGHAADAAAGADAHATDWAFPPTNMRWRCGGCAICAASIWASCSTRTCWATISTPGWRNRNLYKRTFRNCAIIAGPDRAAHDRAARRPAGR